MNHDNFDARFDAAYSAQRDRQLYLEEKGYYWDGFRYRWEPQDWVDLEPLDPMPDPPGAMRAGALDDWDDSNVEEF